MDLSKDDNERKHEADTLEAREYVAKHIAEKFAITITHAQAVVDLAGIGEREAAR